MPTPRAHNLVVNVLLEYYDEFDVEGDQMPWQDHDTVADEILRTLAIGGWLKHPEIETPERPNPEIETR